MLAIENEVVKQLHERKSVRIFDDREVPEKIKQGLLDAAIQAPTAGNQILYTILDIQNTEIKQTLARTCDDQKFIATAPVVLVFVADCRRWMDIYDVAGIQPRKPGVGDILLACEDAMIAAQNTVVAAHSMGLGSCYIGDIVEKCEEVRDVLHLDRYTLPVGMVVYGYATEQQKERKKPERFDKKYIVQQDTYKRYNKEQLREMFAQRHPEKTFDFDRYIEAFYKRKYDSPFSEEMTRSVAKYLKEFVPFDAE